jgi:hypothetical protein
MKRIHHFLPIMLLCTLSAFKGYAAEEPTAKEYLEQLKKMTDQVENLRADFTNATNELRKLAEFHALNSPPIGSIIAYGGELPSAGSAELQSWETNSGWMLCDGRALKQDDYKELFAVIKQSHGEGYGFVTDIDSAEGQSAMRSLTKKLGRPVLEREVVGRPVKLPGYDFNLPDLRGMFLRGVNGERRDFDQPHQLMDPGATRRTNSFDFGPVAGASVGSYQRDEVGPHTHAFTLHIAKSDVGASYPGGSSPFYEDSPKTKLGIKDNDGIETRPRNVYVHFLIKFAPAEMSESLVTK